MKIFITDGQKAEFEHLHDARHDKRVYNRIKAILLALVGWNPAIIVQALHLYEIIISLRISDHLNERKLKPENGSSDGVLNVDQTESSIGHLSQHLCHHPHEIGAYAAQRWNIWFSIPCINKWLHYYSFNFFNEICKHSPDYREKIYLIVDDSDYNRIPWIKDYSYLPNIELHYYFSLYSTNLNAIERLCKVMKEHVWNNRYIESTREYRDAIFGFISTTLSEIAASLMTKIHDRFQVFNPAS